MRWVRELQYPQIIASGRKRVAVILDGVEQVHVETADEEKSYVVRAVLDAKGELQLDPANPEDFWIETVCGKVKIEIRSLH